jgi:hypothetical protein
MWKVDGTGELLSNLVQDHAVSLQQLLQVSRHSLSQVVSLPCLVALPCCLHVTDTEMLYK